jgi:nucleoid-associated protein YgaU
MTSDAKIGLLLGLVFIFIIAFIINGMPGFHENSNNSELTGTMVNSQNKTPGIGTAEREIINRQKLIQRQDHVVTGRPPADDQSVRFETALPKNISAAKTVEVKPTIAAETLLPVKKVESVSKRHFRSSRDAKQSRWYVVREGDSLWRIAAKQLGAGTRYTEIAKLNADILHNEDTLVPGMRLKMPTR